MAAPASATPVMAMGFPSKTLKFVYRTDGSGTTFGFSNHLSAVCASGSVSTSQQFTAGTGTTPPYVVNTPPANSIGASGNVGVASTIKSTDGAIGYAEAANSLADRNPAAGLNFALVNAFDPIKNLPEAANLISGTTGIVKDSVVVTSGVPSTVSPLSPPPAHAGCVLLVKPSAYAKLTTGYPIVAVSYHLYSYAGNGLNDTDLRLLGQALVKSGIVYNNQTGTKNITTVDAATSTAGTGTTGFSTLGTSFRTPVTTAANSCIGA